MRTRRPLIPIAVTSAFLFACAPAPSGSDAGDSDAGGPDAGAPSGSTIGAACTTDADCAATDGTRCLTEADDGFRGGYCDLAAGCATDQDCPSDTHCGYLANGRGACLPNCADNGDCRSDGYLCADFDGDDRDECDRAATGPGAVGAACAHDWDCSGGVRGSCATELTSGYKGGMCLVSGCTADSACPNGSHCSRNGQGDPGTCLPDCTNDGSCRGDGYGCYDSDGDSKKECAPSGTGTGAVGTACAGAWDCAGGVNGLCLREYRTDHKGGYCTLGCDESHACPTGAHCGATGLCQADCAIDGDCRGSGYACADTDGNESKECVASGTGPGAIGAACAGLWDCAGGPFAVCLNGRFDGMPGGYCSIYCLDDGRCGEGAHCAYIGEEGGYCFQTCSQSNECRSEESYSCFDGDNDSVNECSR